LRLLSRKGQANYSASKAAVYGLSKSLAREACFGLGKNGLLVGNPVGVTVNTISPGFIDTEMTQVIPDKVRSKILAQIPAARMGTADEVARCVVFLASDASGYITGQDLSINGGMQV
jgi:3-oxoacyl-[acyl-carrier protein] reductase